MDEEIKNRLLAAKRQLAAERLQRRVKTWSPIKMKHTRLELQYLERTASDSDHVRLLDTWTLNDALGPFLSMA